MNVSVDNGKMLDERGPERDLILSSRDGFVWASWPDTDATCRLGRQDRVLAVMEDFLTQVSVGARLRKRGWSCQYKD